MNDLIYSNQQSFFNGREIVGFGNDLFYIIEIDRKIADDIIKKNHYSKKVVVVGHHKIDLGIYFLNKLVGVLQYGYSMNPISCKNIVDGTTTDQYLELNRMWIDDNAGEYPESKAISYSVKYIKSKFPKIKWIQSFADERCGGNGIVYQACSFNYYGYHESIFHQLDGEIIHNSRFTNTSKKSNSRYNYYNNNRSRAIQYKFKQFRYIKFLNKKWEKKCLLIKQEYPKHYKN